MEFHHLGIATEDIDNEVSQLRKIFPFLKIIKRVFDNLQDVELCLIEIGGLNIELISGKKVKSFLKRGNKLYHICFQVKNLDGEIANLVNNGCMLISPPKPAILFENKKVCFLITPTKVIIELLEK
jgi:methylmalonyl-CoA/ethylmalonyl-CoA epimerase